MDFRLPQFRSASLRFQVLQALALLLITFMAFWVGFSALLRQIEIGRSVVQDEWHETHYALEMSRALSELHAQVSAAAVEGNAPAPKALEKPQQLFVENLRNLRGYQLSQSKYDDDLQEEEGEALIVISRDFEEIQASLEAASADQEFPDYYYGALYHQFEKLEREIDRFVQTTEREVEDAIETIGRAQIRFKRALIAWAASLLIFVALFFAAFTAYFVLPISRLNRAVQRIARRDFNKRVRIGRNNELGELADTINSMAEALAQFTTRIEGELERSQRLASLGRLAAGIAHEINNPLASIAACSEGILKRWERAPENGAHIELQDLEYLRLIRGEVQRCKGITEKLLGLSRERPARFAPFNLSDVTRDVIDLVRHSPLGEHASIRFDPPSESVLSRGDANQIKQVVLNLDAVKDNGAVEVVVENRKDSVRLSIIDSGIGMTAQQIDQVFEPFFSTKDPGVGTGIGLTLAYAIIKAHDGKLTASSKGTGQGSTFTIRLPKWREVRDSETRGELVHVSR